MMMDEVVFVCKCGETFSLDEAGTSYFDGQPLTCCPSCGSTNIEEGERCKVCRGIYRKDQIRAGACIYRNHKGEREGCFVDAVDSFNVAMGYLFPWQKGIIESEFGISELLIAEDE